MTGFVLKYFGYFNGRIAGDVNRYLPNNQFHKGSQVSCNFPTNDLTNQSSE